MDSIQPAMQRFIDAGKTPGLSTLVSRKGEIIHAGCYGFLDEEAGKPIQPDSIFRIFSLTKPITSVALLMLINDGLVTLDDPISTYFPELRQMKVYAFDTQGNSTLEELQQEITIWHLLTHTSGLAYGIGIDDHPVEQMYIEAGLFEIPLAEMIKKLAELPLANQPGAIWRYSISHDVIGHLSEILTDMPLDLFLQERLFQPLGMEDTGFFVPENKRKRFGPFYDTTAEGELMEVEPVNESLFLKADRVPSAGGGLVSTIGDYARFLALLTPEHESVPRLLSRDCVQEMTTNQLTGGQLPIRFADPWPGMGFGYGIGVQKDHRPESGWPAGTFGWFGSGCVHAWVFPQEAMFMITMNATAMHMEPGETLRTQVYEAIGP